TTETELSRSRRSLELSSTSRLGGEPACESSSKIDPLSSSTGSCTFGMLAGGIFGIAISADPSHGGGCVTACGVPGGFADGDGATMGGDADGGGGSNI